jgi:hypothetical protein
MDKPCRVNLNLHLGVTDTTISTEELSWTNMFLKLLLIFSDMSQGKIYICRVFTELTYSLYIILSHNKCHVTRRSNSFIKVDNR